MKNNPYPIQIRKRMLCDFIFGITVVTLVGLTVGIFFMFVGLEFHNYMGGLSSVLVIILMLSLAIPLAIHIGWDYLYLNSIEYSLGKTFSIKSGVVSRSEKLIPYSRIQHVIIYESLWQRILGLSSLSIETAREGIYTNVQHTSIQRRTGSFIPDLEREDALKLKEQIMSISNKDYKVIAGI